MLKAAPAFVSRGAAMSRNQPALFSGMEHRCQFTLQAPGSHLFTGVMYQCCGHRIATGASLVKGGKRQAIFWVGPRGQSQQRGG